MQVSKRISHFWVYCRHNNCTLLLHFFVCTSIVTLFEVYNAYAYLVYNWNWWVFTVVRKNYCFMIIFLKKCLFVIEIGAFCRIKIKQKCFSFSKSSRKEMYLIINVYVRRRLYITVWNSTWTYFKQTKYMNHTKRKNNNICRHFISKQNNRKDNFS